jgi:hypothetical protein
LVKMESSRGYGLVDFNKLILEIIDRLNIWHINYFLHSGINNSTIRSSLFANASSPRTTIRPGSRGG